MSTAPDLRPANLAARANTWRDCTLPVLDKHPGIFCGMSVTVVPFGGSINNADRITAVQTSGNGIGNYLVNHVRVGLLGLPCSAIGHNSVSPPVSQKDSSLLTREDMSNLARQIEWCQADMILVPMGTGKMTEVGRFLERNLSATVRQEKLVLLTGSHDLFTVHPGDGKFNLGFTYAQRFGVERGVRIALHMGVFRPDEIAIQNEPRGVYFLDDSTELNYSPIAANTLLIGMGGTIEGQESTIAQKFERGFCRPYLTEVIRPKQEPGFYSLAVDKDSRELSDKHLAQLKALVKSSHHSEIVVTVGTYGAERVGEFLTKDPAFMQMLTKQGKRVVFAVACELPTEQHSDAFFNLGFALGSVAHLSPGVYLSVHGLISEIGAMTKRTSSPAQSPHFAPVHG